MKQTSFIAYNAMPVFDDLKAKLQELFMFDRADLDFGMYRILNAKRVEVTRFLETELLPSARAALGSVTAEDQARLKAAVDAAREQARKFGAPDPDATDAVKEAQAAYKAASDTASIEEEIYSHLLAFFSRYYQEGDFIPQRRYSAAGRERYMIPYDGEEVKLVWANMEQYYIKSSETLTDYVFTFDHPTGKKRVEFKLIAATEENANNKSQTGERRFAHADLAANPVTVSADGETLTIAFTYVEHPKATKQADLLSKCEVALAAAAIPEPYKTTIFAADPSFTGKGSRTLLRKHLDVYAAKNTYDYFIHKDLGGFLRRELDYFIKNEVLRIDDLLPEDPSAARQQLKKVRALRRLALQIIAFLEQIENFQKKLWLKKKFVTEVRYCLTLDHIPEEYYPEIASNKLQREEWKQLFSIQGIAADTIGQPGYPGEQQPLSPAFLKANQFLVLDFQNFSPEFQARVIASIPNLDAALSGVCIQSENFQAERFVENRYRNQVDVILTDPPYNTKSDIFPYRDGFKHSSWLAMLAGRLSAARAVLAESGAAFFHIDENEHSRASMLATEVFGETNRVGDVVWINSSKNDQDYISMQHEYIVGSVKNAAINTGEWRERKEGLEEIYAQFEKFRKRLKDDWKAIHEAALEWYGQFHESNPISASRHYTWMDERGVYFPDNISGPNFGQYRYDVIHPVTKKVCKSPASGWRYPEDTMLRLIADNLVHFGDDESTVPNNKTYLKDTEYQSFTSIKYRDGRVASKLLEHMFGDKKVFPNPKDVEVSARLLRSVGTKSSLVFDIFAGSGTTGHSVIQLNREDSGTRKYVLVEMGDYFESILVPRLKKAAYSANWKKGIPARDSGTSQAFKIIKLESYEDALNNLRLPSLTAPQVLALEGASTEARADFLLRYSLELETRDSASLLDITKFAAPWSYQISIHRKGETKPATVDLVESFNWLLGLRIQHQDTLITVTSEFETDSSGRTSVKKGSLRKAAQGWTFQAITGRDHSGRLQLIIWRSLSGNVVQDNAVLDAFFQKQGYNTRDYEFDTIYVNGDNNLANLSLSAATPDSPGTHKVKLIETEFHRLMWDVRDI